MTETTIIKCDGCGSTVDKNSDEYKKSRWYTVEVEINGQGQKGNKDVAHVDSWDCLALWANEQKKRKQAVVAA